MAEWNFRLRAKLDNDGKVSKMITEPLEKDWAEWDAEHPYEPHPRVANEVAGSQHDEHGESVDLHGTGDSKGTEALADQFAADHADYGAQDGRELAEETWTSTFEGCTATQNAADELAGSGSGDWKSELDDPADAGMYAFAAKDLMGTIGDPGAAGHVETDDTLYRGIKDPDGSIAAKFAEGSDVQFTLAAFSDTQSIADYFATTQDGVAHELMLQTTGDVSGVDMRSDGSSEIVSGGTFHVESIEHTGTSDRPRTVVTLSQTAPPKVAS